MPVAVLLALPLVGCHRAPPQADRDAPPAPPPAAVADSGPGAHGPGIVFILADDFTSDLIQYMPNLQAMQKGGTTFANYFVADSLCCPSRATIFTGRLPHHTGVRANGGGYAAFVHNGNDGASFAPLLQRAGYRTAMLGKYLNGYEPGHNPAAPGWSEWVVGGAAYRGYDYDLDVDGQLQHHGSAPEDYLGDVLAQAAVASIRASAGRPLFIEIATYAPHTPATAAPRDEAAFPVLMAPRGRTFGARPDARAPTWLREMPPLDDEVVRKIDAMYRKRARSVLALDRMIGDIRSTLASQGRADDTYVFFSSDNGFHMGDYSLGMGKQTPYDVDVKVPLVVVGPHVPAGRTVAELAESIDLCPTFTEVAGTAPATPPDGRSLVPLIHGETPRTWRAVVPLEHRRPPADATDPDAPLGPGDLPPSYDALRTAQALYVEYEGGSVEYHDLTKDPDELANTAAALPADVKGRLHAILRANVECADGPACAAAQSSAP